MSKIDHLYATADNFTPLFHDPAWHTLFRQDLLPLQNNLLKELEMIAFFGSVFEVMHQNNQLLEVRFAEYPSSVPLYTDIRFVTQHVSKPDSPIRNRPSLSQMLETMLSVQGAPYLWGGNCHGVDKMLTMYPSTSPIESLGPVHQHTRSLQGFDCSGLLYFASQGTTPRNTSSLVDFGHPVAIQNKPYEQWGLLPGDLLVWKGHVLIVVDAQYVIESLGGVGVVLSPLKTRIEKIHKELHRHPVDDWSVETKIPEAQRYVIRRWAIDQP